MSFLLRGLRLVNFWSTKMQGQCCKNGRLPDHCSNLCQLILATLDHHKRFLVLVELSFVNVRGSDAWDLIHTGHQAGLDQHTCMACKPRSTKLVHTVKCRVSARTSSR
jgi:hypothetical protein